MMKKAALRLTFGRELAIVSALLILAFMIRFAFFSNPGFEKTDTLDFKIWFQTAADYGPRVFYSVVWCDYPPFNIYFFWVFGLIAKNLSLFASNLFLYIMKLPPNLFDLATAAVIFVFVGKRASFKMALLAMALYAFNPAVIFNAAVWGQFDAIYTFLLVLSLYLISESKPKLAMVAFMLGVLTKPQSIAIAPLVLFLIFRKYHWNWKRLIIPVLVAVATVFIVILPFEWNNPVTFLSDKYFGAYSTYPYTTLNAFNFWAFGGMWVSDVQGFSFITPYVLGWAMFAALSMFVLYFVHKRRGASDELLIMFAAFVLFFGFFMLPTRIHERYLFPAISILALMFPLLKKTRPLYIALTVTCFVNQAYVLPLLNASQFIQPGDMVVFAASLINSIAFIYVLMLMFGELWGRKWLSSSPLTTQANAVGEGSR
jgi:Gpi18-like mannosyltransferase